MRTLLALVVIAAVSVTACKKKEVAEDKPAEPVAPAPVEPAPAPTPAPEPAPAPAGTGTIIDVAKGAGSFNTLLTAVEAAGLTDTLKGAGPFTVFAPSDEAFAKIPKADLDKLLADKAKLAAVLSYHVLPGKVMAKDVGTLTKATTVGGQDISIDTAGGAVTIGDAKVVKTDIEASNGVIHVIDAVVMPPG